MLVLPLQNLLAVDVNIIADTSFEDTNVKSMKSKARYTIIFTIKYNIQVTISFTRIIESVQTFLGFRFCIMHP